MPRVYLASLMENFTKIVDATGSIQLSASFLVYNTRIRRHRLTEWNFAPFCHSFFVEDGLRKSS